MSFFAYAGGFALLLLFLAFVLGMAICAAQSPNADVLSREEDTSSMLGTGWPAGFAVSVSSGHAEHSLSNGREIGK